MSLFLKWRMKMRTALKSSTIKKGKGRKLIAASTAMLALFVALFTPLSVLLPVTLLF